MIIKHKIGKDFISKKIFNTLDRNLSIFMLNKRGHYFSIPAKNTDKITNFNGWFNVIDQKDLQDGKYFSGYDLYKSIDNIYLDKETSEIVNNYSNIQRVSNDTIETFYLAKNGLIYEVESYKGYINLDLDFREIYNTDDKGRIYYIYRHEDLLIIEYQKYSDDTKSNLLKTMYLAIKGVNAYDLINKWTQKIYSYDVARKNKGDFYIYNAIKIGCNNNIKLYFSFSENKEDAIKKVEDIFVNYSTILEDKKNYVSNVLAMKNSVKDSDKFNVSKELSKEIAFAYSASINALDGLAMQLAINHKKISGMWAGLPWFFQYWSRDELISVIPLILEHRYDYSKEILVRYLSEIMADGRLPNRYPSANLSSADSVGWLFKRAQQFLAICELRDNFHNYFSLYDLTNLRDRLRFSIKKILEKHSSEGLITNNAQETWMDTFNNEAYDKDYRDGFRIEIQTLFLAQLKLLGMLENYLSNKYVKKNDRLVKVTRDDLDVMELEKSMKKLVREKFLKNIDGKIYLSDGYNSPMDTVSRPNIFLAYYIYPELLTKEEWIQVFDYNISRLWCDWDLGEGVKGGGFSTIDKSHYLYQPYYTGIDNKSYHRGDSWFWVNNVSAIAMYRLDKKRYGEYIQEILTSSAQDILYWGFIGYSSELASSGWFKSGGCLCQTWSIATYIELIHEIFIDE